MPIYPPNADPVLAGIMQAAGVERPSMTVLDVGCSGGIDPVWSPYFDFVDAIGIDPLVAEIARLRQTNGNPRHRYFDGFVIGPPPVRDPARAIQGWFDRATALEAHRLVQFDYVQAVHNSGQPIEKSNNRFTVDDFCSIHGVERVDFLKSDTDGFDFSVLSGARETLKNTLGVHVEGTFASEGTGAIFRDMDGLMDEAGLYLVGLRPSYYTRTALPGRFNHRLMGDEDRGACCLADFLYLRDVVKFGPGDLNTALKIALIAELYNLADIAAEALVPFRSDSVVTELLNGLVKYSGDPSAGSYDELIRRFRADPRRFAPS